METVGVIGFGKMGQAIISGIQKNINANQSDMRMPKFICSVSQRTADHQVAQDSDIRLVYGDEGNAEIVKSCDLILLCTKPHIAQSVFDAELVRQAFNARPLGNQPLLIISILAGVTLEQLKQMLPNGTAIIRAMPNTACRIQQGMTVLCTHPDIPVPDAQRQLAFQIFSSLGRCRFMDEKHIDVATGLAACGPAFACVMLESMADGGVSMGLQRDVALELAAQAMLGACQLHLQTGKHPAVLKDEITTPAGCTIAGLMAMEDGKVRSTIARAVEVATTTASALGRKPSSK